MPCCRAVRSFLHKCEQFCALFPSKANRGKSRRLIYRSVGVGFNKWYSEKRSAATCENELVCFHGTENVSHLTIYAC
jgi:hypothetical protein